MSSAPHTALIVDDDDAIRYTLRAYLEDGGFEVVEAKDGVEGLAAVEAHQPSLVLTDMKMPVMDGLTFLRHLAPVGDDAPLVVMLTAHGSEGLAVEAMKLGAFDYFKKPFEPDLLRQAIVRARDVVETRAGKVQVEAERHLGKSLLFASPSMGRLAVLVARVAPREVTVLLTGESGTGKERVAEAIVAASARKDAPFVRFNCAALSPELVESELFGHAKGAFTGAVRARPGMFREADGGTLLLDEIGELDARAQAKLLRVLQEREVRPVGEDQSVAVDVRIIAATHRDLPQLVADGSFREDLYYRLKVVHLTVPPLRERPEDIVPLFRHFLQGASTRFGTGPLRLPAGVEARLLAYPWPGNVRELENAVESLVALSSDGTIDELLLPASSSSSSSSSSEGDGSGPSPGAGLRERLDAYERGLLVAALKDAQGNRSQAARALGIGRATLHEKLDKHGIGATDERP